MKKALVIIPAYNEEGNIIKTVEDIKKNAPSFDYVIINDCSKDFGDGYSVVGWLSPPCRVREVSCS